MLQLNSVGKKYGGDRLFTDVNWTIPDSGKVFGVVGPNGAGKTTLFEVIAGIESPDEGEVIRSKNYSVGYLSQEIEPESSETVLDAILRGASHLVELEAKLERLREEMEDKADSEEVDEISEKYGRLQSRFRSLGGYGFRSEAKEIAEGLGFSEAELDQPLQVFSGGWRVRVAIGQLLLGGHDLLLLDEPTNHLDLESIEWFSSYLKKTDQTIALISHDRALLNESVDEIVEVANKGIQFYSGDYDTYLKEREEYRQECLKKAKEQQKKIEKIKAFVEKFRYNASKASLVQSRIKKLEKMEPIEVPPEHHPTIDFEFPEPDRIPQKLIELENISKSFGTNHLYSDVNLTIWRGSRIAITGPNGSGKTTFLKILSGTLEPDTGEVDFADDIQIGYFAQHSLSQLNADNTILEEVSSANPELSGQRIRTILGSLQIRGDDVRDEIGVLSGGEKKRVLLAKILVEQNDCIFLDEPTNHLDIPSREILESALQNFSGVVCVISHDRAFLKNLTDRVLHIKEGYISLFKGSYDAFLESRNRGEDSESEASSADTEYADAGDQASISKKQKRRLAAQMRQKRKKELKPLHEKLQEVESDLEDLEAERDELEEQLSDPETYERNDIGKLQKKFGKLEKQIDELMERWEALQLEIEEIRSQYQQKLEEAIEKGASEIVI